MRPKQPDVARGLNNLGLLLYEQGRRTEAKPYYQRAFAIREKTLPADPPLIARTRTYLELCLLQGPWRELSNPGS